jgi:1-phosphofructokinase family hexose kinase
MKIISVLLNPTIDQIYEIENFHVGGTFQVKVDPIVYPVGKAISLALGVRELIENEEQNILKVIACIGKDEISLYSKFLKSKKINFEFIPVEERTRSNKTINDPINRTTTHIRERGFNLSESELRRFIRVLENNIQAGDFVILSGSIPPNVREDIYFELINLVKQNKAIPVLDANGSALLKGIKANPKIIKPNLLELSQILHNEKINDIDFSDLSAAYNSIAQEGKVLINNELNIVLITLGKYGAICLTEKLDYYGNVQVDKVIDTVGTGDAFLAGFVLMSFQKRDLQECFKYAIACGAAKTQIPGPGIFEKKLVKKLVNSIKLIKIN